MKTPKLLQRLAAPRLLLSGLVLLCLVQCATIFLLLRTRAEAEPVLSRSDELAELADQGPYVQQAMVNVLLSRAADELTELAQSHIRYTFHVSETVPINADVAVNERIPVPVSLVVSETIPIEAAIPFQEKVVVPVRLEIDQVFSVSTTIPFQDQIAVPIDEVIHVDERFKIRLFGQEFTIPIRGDIPVKLNVQVPIDKQFPVRADVPVQFPISETLPVEIDWTVPVALEIPVNLPVETTVVVPLSRTIPIHIQAPIVLDVPIDVALSDTPLGAYLLELGEYLRRITAGD